MYVRIYYYKLCVLSALVAMYCISFTNNIIVFFFEQIKKSVDEFIYFIYVGFEGKEKKRKIDAKAYQNLKYKNR